MDFDENGNPIESDEEITQKDTTEGASSTEDGDSPIEADDTVESGDGEDSDEDVFDLAFEGESTKAASSNWQITGDSGLEVVSAGGWDGAKAKNEILKWAGFGTESWDPTKASKGFFLVDKANTDKKGAFKFPFCRVKEGTLQAVAEGLSAVLSRIGAAKGVTSQQKDSIKSKVGKLKGETEKETTKGFRNGTVKEGVTVKGLSNTGEYSLSEMQDRVRSQWEKQHGANEPPSGWESMEYDDRRHKDHPYFRYRVDDVTTEVVVVYDKLEGVFVAYPWSSDNAGGVTFDTPYQVASEWTRVMVPEPATLLSSPLTMVENLAVKSIGTIKDNRLPIAYYLLLWGSSAERDLHEQYFSKSTNLGLDMYPTVPTFFHHGLDPAIGIQPMGRRIKAAPDDVGLWVESWLDTSNKYWGMVEPLLEAKRLYGSPGSAPHLVRVSKSGFIETFPIIEDTLTPVPAQFRLSSAAEIKAHYALAQMPIPSSIETGGHEEDQDAGRAFRLRLAKVRVQL